MSNGGALGWLPKLDCVSKSWMPALRPSCAGLDLPLAQWLHLLYASELDLADYCVSGAAWV